MRKFEVIYIDPAHPHANYVMVGLSDNEETMKELFLSKGYFCKQIRELSSNKGDKC